MKPFAHAAPYERSLLELRNRAMFTKIALGATMVAYAFGIAARQWSVFVVRAFAIADPNTQEAMLPRLEGADHLVNLGVWATVALFVITAILFLRWVHRLVTLTEQLGAGPLRWAPGASVWAFIIPVVSFVRPLQVLQDVQERLNPEKIEPPVPYVDPEGPVDYRTVAFVTPPPPKAIPGSVLGLWWACFTLSSLLARFANRASGALLATPEPIVSTYHFAMGISVGFVVAAGLAILVVRSLTARLEERFRRVRFTAPESLARQGIVLR